MRIVAPERWRGVRNEAVLHFANILSEAVAANIGSWDVKVQPIAAGNTSVNSIFPKPTTWRTKTIMQARVAWLD